MRTAIESSCTPPVLLPAPVKRHSPTSGFIRFLAFLCIITFSLQISKRKALGDPPRHLSLELDEEQVAALQLVPENLHPNLECLIPVLDAIRKAYGNVVPPHRKALPVNTNLSLYQKTLFTS